MRPRVYIPNYNGGEHLRSALRSLAAQARPADVLVVDNGSTDGSTEMVREEFSEVGLFELGHNAGFGPAINRAVEAHPGDPVILVNNDAECQPGFVAELLGALSDDVQMVAGVMLQGAAPELIDSAGVIADRTLMGFDYLHGEAAETARGAPAPLGPTGGAALYRREAFEMVGGFDERIFLYYEDLDLALRMRAAGAGCRLAAEARALHAYSASLGAKSGEKFSRTGWSRGYILRRYGVMARPRNAARVLVAEGTICAGQLLMDRTGKGIGGRLRGWHEAAGLDRRDASGVELSGISMRQALKLRRRRRG